MARELPPKKPAYPNPGTQRRSRPQRPVYTYDADVPRMPRRPAEKRISYHYESKPAEKQAAPFVNTAPQPPRQPEAPAPRWAFSEDAGRARQHAPTHGASQPPQETRAALAAQAQRKPAQQRPAAPDPARRGGTQERTHRPPDAPQRRGQTGRPPARTNGAGRPAPGPGAGRRPGKTPPRGGARSEPPPRPRQKRPAPPLTPEQARRRKRNRAILAGVFAAALLTVGLLISAAVLFKIKTITLEAPEGDLAYDAAQIRAAFGHGEGENLFGFSAGEAQQKIAEALPYLEQVSIKRRLPDTVVITASPATEAYTVESAAGWVVLSRHYKVLRLDAEPPAGLVRIQGAQADAPSPGQPLQLTEADKLPLLQTLQKKAEEQGLTPIDEIDLTDTLELSFLYQGRIRIVLGTANDLDYKLKWAWRMVTPGETSDSLGAEDRGTLDVSSRGEDGLGRARWRAGVL